MPGWFGFHFQFLYVPKFCVPGHGSYHSYQLQAKSATERQVQVDHVGIQLTRLAIMGIELEILEEKRYDIIYIYTSKKINGCLQLVFFLCAHCTHHPPDFVGLFMSVSGNETPSSGSMESLDRNSALFTSQNERVFGWRHWPTAICRAMLWEARSWLDLIQASIEIGFVHMYAWIHI